MCDAGHPSFNLRIFLLMSPKGGGEEGSGTSQNRYARTGWFPQETMRTDVAHTTFSQLTPGPCAWDGTFPQGCRNSP